MRPLWVDLDERERAVFQAVFAFLRSRLADWQSIEWALRLSPGDRAKRIAVLVLIDREVRRITEPWNAAWRLIEESWASGGVDEHDTTGQYAAKKRLQDGDRSGALTHFITDLIAPRLKLEARIESTKRPRTIHDLLSMRLTSGTYIDPRTLGLETITEPDFLTSLARSLDSALIRGLEWARQTGWSGQELPWQIGALRRVFHVSADTSGDPDKYNRGIAPCVKLLYEVVNRLAVVQASRAREFAQHWRAQSSPVHLRLWAALARDAALVDAADISQMLRSVADEQFWSLHYYPEVTELRARRFADLDGSTQATLTARIRKLPPRRLWRKGITRSELENARLGRAIEELRRIQTSAGSLSRRDQDWLTSNGSACPNIPGVVSVDYGFTQGVRARWVGPKPERGYDVLSGEERLKVLETALSTAERRWDDNPAQRAFDWLRENNNALKVIAELETLTDAGASFPNVWNTLGSTHHPPHEPGSTDRNSASEAERVFSMLQRLPDSAARQSIDGIAHWLLEWRGHFTSALSGLWLRLWPMAVDATNARETIDTLPPSEAVIELTDARESRMEMATLNTPTGQLVSTFVSACPDVREGHPSIEQDTNLRAMRDAILDATGRSRLIALHRLIEDLPYFLAADHGWAEENLLAMLNADDPQATALWRAIARETRFHDVLKPIGEAMAFRAADNRLSRDTRQGLTFSLVIECLHALNEKRDPAVPDHKIMQMLRSVDDEVRVHAAHAVQRFISEVASDTTTAEELFQRAVGRFLREVWPQERSLVTPSISGAFARIPAAAAGTFSEAVSTVERFLVPFDCWGLYEYGLDTDDSDGSRLAHIDSPDKAAALLRLLDLTVGPSESAVVPHDLSRALEQIRAVAPSLIGGRTYRRLLTAARRA